MLLRRSLCALFALLALGLAACGGADQPTQVATEGAPDPGGPSASTTVAADPTAAPTTTAVAPTSAPTTTAATAADPTTTTAPPSGPSAASPVPGLDAVELQAALAAPSGATARTIRTGPTVDQVILEDGTRVWRVRVPGAFTARSARVSISVGNREVGEGVLAPDLQSITAVTTDGTGLSAGRPVTYQWEGSSAVVVGNLAVIR